MRAVRSTVNEKKASFLGSMRSGGAGGPEICPHPTPHRGAARIPGVALRSAEEAEAGAFGWFFLALPLHLAQVWVRLQVYSPL